MNEQKVTTITAQNRDFMTIDSEGKIVLRYTITDVIHSIVERHRTQLNIRVVGVSTKDLKYRSTGELMSGLIKVHMQTQYVNHWEDLFKYYAFSTDNQLFEIKDTDYHYEDNIKSKKSTNSSNKIKREEIIR